MKKRVLLVDDSQTIICVMRAFLMDTDCELLVAADADGALKMVLREQPDLVISDIQMPGMSGLDLCRVLRGAPRLRGVRLVLISGSWSNERQEEARRIGVDGCLQKPVNPEQLVTMVKRLLA